MKRVLAKIMILWGTIFPVCMYADVFFLASVFNQQFSCTHPYIMTQNTTIDLDENIIISGNCPLIIADKTLNLRGTLTFTSATNNAVIVEQESIWQLSSFFRDTQIIQFTGNALLTMGPGAVLVMNGAQLRFAGSSIWNFIPESPDV
ncbi:MAG TPA: hypothetical protein VEK38_01635 [Candidatus Bathyarchaeia archaeon]|nr:hypothetical protein [Candidatus Bathyarchaeia archaeon]